MIANRQVYYREELEPRRRSRNGQRRGSRRRGRSSSVHNANAVWTEQLLTGKPPSETLRRLRLQRQQRQRSRKKRTEFFRTLVREVQARPLIWWLLLVPRTILFAGLVVVVFALRLLLYAFPLLWAACGIIVPIALASLVYVAGSQGFVVLWVRACMTSYSFALLWSLKRYGWLTAVASLVWSGTFCLLSGKLYLVLVFITGPPAGPLAYLIAAAVPTFLIGVISEMLAQRWHQAAIGPARG